MSAVENAKAVMAKDSASSAELTAARKELALHRTKVQARLEAISSKGFGKDLQLGPERRKLAEAGDAEGLVAMAAEEDRLNAESEIIITQDNRLQGRITQARADEAMRDLPALHVELADCLAREEAATKALHAARAETDRMVTRGHELRMHIRGVIGMESAAPKADLDLVRRFVAARGFVHHPHNGYGSDIHQIVRFGESIGQGPDNRRNDFLAS